MEKLYDRIDFHNNAAPALNESNLNAISKAIDDIDNRLIKVANSGPGGGGGSSVEWDQLKKDGEKIAEITIDGKKQDVFAPEGGSGSVTEYGTTAEFEAEKDSFPVGTEYLITDDYDSEGGFDYSEEEICVGTYMGKKRYVKICPVTRTTATQANTWSAVASAPANVERVIHIEFSRVNDALGTIVSQYSRLYNGSIELYNTFTIGATAMVNAHILIEYTKVGE